MEWIACYSIASFVAGLTADTDYTIFVTDRHGNLYRQDITTDGAGNFDLDLTLFDEGMFTADSGCYTLQASLNDLVPIPEIMIVGYQEYTCIKISFLDIT
jgi:hypothetical protein